MTFPSIPDENYSPRWEDDSRPELSGTGDERAVLTGLLDWHRATFASKCAGVSAEQMAHKAVPPSGLSLHGLVRHLAGVERWWFTIQLAGQGDAPMLFYSDEDPDQDFDFTAADVDADLALWRAECERSRAVVAARSLDDTGTRIRDGAAVSVRYVLADLIAEYARHNGHADLLRERIDGRTGR